MADEPPVTIDPLPERAAHLAKLVASLNDRMVDSNEAIVISNERIAESNERIAALSASTKRRVRWLWAAVAVALLALVGVGYAIKATHDQADENLATLRRACEETNDSRARTVSVWETFMRIAAPTPTPEQQARIDELLAFVHDTYRPRDCTLPHA